jgi:nitronate monooxygenase
MRSVLARLRHPIVQAPMAGGPGTPQLAAAVCEAGGLGFLAAGYVDPDALRSQVAALRQLTEQPFGVNVFVPSADPGDPAEIARYAGAVAPLAAAHGVDLGAPVHDDDHYDAKIEVVVTERPAVVSFTFGMPQPATIARLHDAGVEVWVTVTDLEEARAATSRGADALVVQGAEAGGHRGSFVDDDREPLPLAALLDLVRELAVPLVATGGLADGAAAARAIAAGATAVQLGTAFLLCPEAGTNAAHRAALTSGRPTVVTRAFTGRRARGIANAWTGGIGADAPRAYPEIHHLTAPLRAHGRATNDPDLLNLWAGTGYPAARAVPAGDLVRALARALDAT